MRPSGLMASPLVFHISFLVSQVRDADFLLLLFSPHDLSRDSPAQIFQQCDCSRCKVCVGGTLGTERSSRIGAPVSHNCTAAFPFCQSTFSLSIIASRQHLPLNLRRRTIPNESSSLPPSQPPSSIPNAPTPSSTIKL